MCCCRGEAAGVRRLSRGLNRFDSKRLHSATRLAIIPKAGHDVCQTSTTHRTSHQILRYRGKMSVSRVIFGILIAPILVLALGRATTVFAQVSAPVGPPAPPLPPVPPPAVTAPPPVQLTPLPTPTPVSALPALAPAPTVVGPIATPTPREFRCSCSGTGTNAQWVGMVQASNPLLADQSAQGMCLGYLAGKYPTAPGISPPNSTVEPPTIGLNSIPGDVYNPSAGLSLPPGLLSGGTVAIGQSLARVRQYGSQIGGRLFCRPCACN